MYANGTRLFGVAFIAAGKGNKRGQIVPFKIAHGAVFALRSAAVALMIEQNVIAALHIYSGVFQFRFAPYPKTVRQYAHLIGRLSRPVPAVIQPYAVARDNAALLIGKHCGHFARGKVAALYFKLLNLLKRRTLGRDDKLHKHPRYREYEGGRNKGCYKQYP